MRLPRADYGLLPALALPVIIMRLPQADYGLLPRGAMRRYDTAERRLYPQRY